LISLNYDNTIECAANGHSLWDFDSSIRADDTDVINNQPPLVEAFNYVAVPTLRLLKLHGSLDWYWIDGDQIGSSIQRWRSPGAFGAVALDDEEARRRLLPGRTPFLIPPSSSKSGYNTNPLTRDLWSQAFESLKITERILLLGYSLPSGDLTMTNMLRDACQGRDIEIVVANIDPEPVIDRLVWIGIPRSQIQTLSSEVCIGDLVTSLLEEATTSLANCLQTWKGDPDKPQTGSLTVTWGQPLEMPVRQQFFVTGVVRVGDEVILQLANHTEPIVPEPAQLGELLNLVDDARRIVAQLPDSKRLPIIGLWTSDQPAGDRYRWISFTAAGIP
jgi:hypothetical protein